MARQSGDKPDNRLSGQAPPVQEAPARRQRKPRRWLRRLIFCAILLLLIGGLGVMGYRMLSGPAEGTISNVMPETTVRQAPAIELEQFDGKYFSFAHPSNYAQRIVKDAPASNLETDQFVASGIINKLVSIAVTPLPSGKLADDSSYYMRTLHPETYKITKQLVQGEPVMLALDTQDYQQAAFWAHSGKLMTFAISSINMDSDTTNNEYQQMLQSVKWR